MHDSLQRKVCRGLWISCQELGEGVSTRTRTTESRGEIYYGDLCWETKKLCKRQIWFWVRKTWSWNDFRFFWKSTTYDCLLLLIVFDYFVKNVQYRKSSILIVSSDFVKGVAHEKSSILTVFSYFEKGVAHVWKIIHFDCF